MMKEMHFFIMLLAFFSIQLVSCQSEGNDNSAQSQTEQFKSEKNTPPPASKIDPKDLAKLDGQLLSFWSEFKTRLSGENLHLIRQLILFPLEGGAAFTPRILNDQPLPETDFTSAYSELFDASTKNIISTSKASELESYEVELDGYEQSKAKLIGIPSGSTVYKLSIITGGSGFNVSAEQTIKTFHFAKVEGEYKLVWVTLK